MTPRQPRVRPVVLRSVSRKPEYAAVGEVDRWQSYCLAVLRPLGGVCRFAVHGPSIQLAEIGRGGGLVLESAGLVRPILPPHAVTLQSHYAYG